MADSTSTSNKFGAQTQPNGLEINRGTLASTGNPFNPNDLSQRVDAKAWGDLHDAIALQTRETPQVQPNLDILNNNAAMSPKIHEAKQGYNQPVQTQLSSANLNWADMQAFMQPEPPPTHARPQRQQSNGSGLNFTLDSLKQAAGNEAKAWGQQFGDQVKMFMNGSEGQNPVHSKPSEQFSALLGNEQSGTTLNLGGQIEQVASMLTGVEAARENQRRQAGDISKSIAVFTERRIASRSHQILNTQAADRLHIDPTTGRTLQTLDSNNEVASKVFVFQAWEQVKKRFDAKGLELILKGVSDVTKHTVAEIQKREERKKQIAAQTRGRSTGNGPAQGAETRMGKNQVVNAGG